MKKKLLKSLVVTLALGAGMHFITACDRTVNYVNKCKLSDYYSGSVQGKNFLDNGIGYVTVKRYVDGDTSHFTQIEDRQRLVKSRYLGVDTPESTGQIEEWGKAASNFTHSKLETAKTIVLTTDVTGIGKPAETDSTGSRFKTLVWVSEKENAKLSELKCLNLWLVQEGYSTGKGLSGSPLTDWFTKADLQAQKKKIHIWDPKGDPNFDRSLAIPTTLEALSTRYAEGEDSDEPEWFGAKIRVQGVVCKLSGDFDAYISVTGEDGSVYGLYIFAGYKSYAPMRTLGNLIEVVGTYTMFMGNPQLTGVSYNSFLPDEKTDMKLISKDNPYEIPTKTVPEISNKESVNLICGVENLYVYKGKTEIDATTQVPSGALTLRCRDANENELSIRVPEDVFVFDASGARIRDASLLEGKTVSAIGAVNFYAPDEDNPYEGYYQLRLCHKDDFHVID